MSEGREIRSHIVNPANDRIKIVAIDSAQTNVGDAPTHYDMQIDGTDTQRISFQNGPILTAGVNGTTHEALIAIVIDRLTEFQKGPYASRHNALALTALEQAKLWLFARTLERMQRGVEGTHER
jgi:hypothetical protein